MPFGCHPVAENEMSDKLNAFLESSPEQVAFTYSILNSLRDVTDEHEKYDIVIRAIRSYEAYRRTQIESLQARLVEALSHNAIRTF